jgi:two-component system sensor histidine kinase KdpD
VIAVVLQSLDCSFREAAAICVLATAALDYFFTEPLFSFTVSGPLEGITLVCLLTVTLVITRIQSRSRNDARESKLQRANMEGLYNVSQDLLALDPPALAGTLLLDQFLSAFGITAVCLFDAATLETHATGAAHADLQTKTRAAFISGESASYPEIGIVAQPFRVSGRTAGAIGFQGLQHPDVTAPALAALAASAVERARAFRSAANAAAHAEAEILRAAILDALAHEFKTPLATILTAAGGLRVGESVMPQQAELAEIIETEASRLGDLTTRLLRLARVDREELKPRLWPADASELAQRSVRRYVKLWPDRKISFHEQEEVGELRVDPELVDLAISQLVENACRYSWPDTELRIEIGIQDGMAAITVWNAGPPIPQGDRERIFDRFYRGAEARSAPGSGLGLYVARKIALAHGGNLALVDGAVREVGFRLTLPILSGEVADAERAM